MYGTTNEITAPPQSAYRDYVATSRFDGDASVRRHLDFAYSKTLQCGASCTVGFTSSAQYGKRLFCGREYCHRCGANGSESHMRRYARMISRVQQLGTLGYWVIQFPMVMRDTIRGKKMWSRVTGAVVKAMKAAGFDKGLRRWHWFGDVRCQNPDCRQFAEHVSGRTYECPRCREPFDVRSSSMTFNPHLNLITESGLITNARLERVKALLRHEVRKAVGFWAGPQLIVNYSYAATIPQILHTVRYVCRATFLAPEWDPGLVKHLEGYRSTWFWGRWRGPEKWTLEEVEMADKALSRVQSLGKGKCPDTGETIEWTGEVMTFEQALELFEYVEDLGGGYLRFGPRRRQRPPGPGERRGA